VKQIYERVRGLRLPSVLWHCWLRGRKGIRPVKKTWVVKCWHGYLSGARCRLAYGPADTTTAHCFAPVKSKLVLPFWYRLTWVVPDRGPLNVCVCVCVRVHACACVCVCVCVRVCVCTWSEIVWSIRDHARAEGVIFNLCSLFRICLSDAFLFFFVVCVCVCVLRAMLPEWNRWMNEYILCQYSV